MTRYLVTSVDGEHIALTDPTGRCHRAQALGRGPALGAAYHGPRPLPGFAVLSKEGRAEFCRVIFGGAAPRPEGLRGGNVTAP